MPEWLQWVGTVGGVLGLGTALATWLRTRPKMKEVELKGEDALWARIAKLEAAGEAQSAELKRERELCDERIGRIEARHADDVGKLEREVRVLRHDRNNVRQALNAMFVMLKREDADVPAIVADIEEMLERGDKVIAVEKGAMTQ